MEIKGSSFYFNITGFYGGKENFHGKRSQERTYLCGSRSRRNRCRNVWLQCKCRKQLLWRCLIQWHKSRVKDVFWSLDPTFLMVSCFSWKNKHPFYCKTYGFHSKTYTQSNICGIVLNRWM